MRQAIALDAQDARYWNALGDVLRLPGDKRAPAILKDEYPNTFGTPLP